MLMSETASKLKRGRPRGVNAQLLKALEAAFTQLWEIHFHRVSAHDKDAWRLLVSIGHALDRHRGSRS